MPKAWVLDPLRKVVTFSPGQSNYARTGHGTTTFVLECGHTVYAKNSQGTPSRKRCAECGQIERHERQEEADTAARLDDATFEG